MKFAINLGEVNSPEISIKNVSLEVQVSGGELGTAYSTVKQAIKELPETVSELKDGLIALKNVEEELEAEANSKESEENPLEEEA